MTRMLGRALALSLFCFIGVSPAAAEPVVNFTITNQAGTEIITFQLPKNPVPDSFDDFVAGGLPPGFLESDGYFEFFLVPIVINGSPALATLRFNLPDRGGVNISASPFRLPTTGPQLFTGPVSAPEFQLGVFALETLSGGPFSHILEISEASTTALPEPATLSLFGFGLFGLIVARSRHSPRS